MAHVSSFLKSYCKGALYGLVFAVLFICAPTLIDRYYPAAAPLAVALRWVADKGMAGLTAATFFLWILMFCLLVGDARKFVRRVMSARAAPPTGPISLEDGTAVTAVPATTDDAAPTPTAAKDMAPAAKLLSILSSTFYLTSQAITTDVISLHRPLLENVGAALKYVLQGCEVLFALFLVLVVIVGVKKQWRGDAAGEAPAPTLSAPVEALVEVGVLVVKDDEKKALVEEKAELV
ncbi:hypothetical protein B0H12DRAFT_1076465 [Mycena haematopus]|nr:hypothetical protein B0H12DRAFT_1076465 [Mycena haematopus]